MTSDFLEQLPACYTAAAGKFAQKRGFAEQRNACLALLRRDALQYLDAGRLILEKELRACHDHRFRVSGTGHLEGATHAKVKLDESLPGGPFDASAIVYAIGRNNIDAIVEAVELQGTMPLRTIYMESRALKVTLGVLADDLAPTYMPQVGKEVLDRSRRSRAEGLPTE
jgi:hypothetical protein